MVGPGMEKVTAVRWIPAIVVIPLKILNMSVQARPKLKQAEISNAVISSFYDVYNDLGVGFLESVYERALAILLTGAGLKIATQHPIKVFFRGHDVGIFRADIIVNQSFLVELKAVKKLHRKHTAQLLNALRATAIEVGLLLNFGPKPEFQRVILTNDRKRHLPSPVDPKDQ
jgi:GxxExxY protein